jgi:hypothetical protein
MAAMAINARLLFLAPLLLAAAACGSDSDTGSPSPDDAAASTASTETETDSEPEPESETDEPDAEPATPAAGGSGGATLTLANGETFEFPNVLCTLEPQMAAGSEILFTATSYDDPGLDITQFGDEGTITGVASISVYDGDYETRWEANSMLGSAVELSLDGSTIRGTGTFFEGDDYAGEPVDGEVIANC